MSVAAPDFVAAFDSHRGQDDIGEGYSNPGAAELCKIVADGVPSALGREDLREAVEQRKQCRAIGRVSHAVQDLLSLIHI